MHPNSGKYMRADGTKSADPAVAHRSVMGKVSVSSNLAIRKAGLGSDGDIIGEFAPWVCLGTAEKLNRRKLSRLPPALPV
jgi:hypothetical protein